MSTEPGAALTAGVVVAALVTSLGPAVADDPVTRPTGDRLDDQVCNTRVEWRAPANCPDRRAFLSLLSAELANAPVDLVHLDIRITRKRDLFVLTWRTSSGTPDWSGRFRTSSDPRSLSDASCAAVVEAAATAIATAIEPVAADTGSLTARPCPQRVDLDVPEVLLPPPVSFAGLDEFPLRGPTIVGLPFDLALQLTLGGDSGTLPGLATSIGAGISTQYGRWRLELSGARLLEQRRTVARGDDEIGGDFSLRLATLRLCAEVYRGLVIASICTGGQLGQFRSVGYNLLRPIDATETYGAAGWGVSFARALRDFLYFRIDINIWSPTIRPLFTVCDVAVTSDDGVECAVPGRPVWQPRRLVTRVFAGIEVMFR